MQVARHATRTVQRDQASSAPAPKNVTRKKSSKRPRIIEDPESEPGTNLLDTKTRTARSAASAAAQAETQGRRVGSRVSRQKDKGDARADDTTTSFSNINSVTVPHQPSSSTAPTSSRPRREASSRIQQGAYSDKAKFITMLGKSGRKSSVSPVRQINGDPKQPSSSMPPPGPSASRPQRPPAASSPYANTNRLSTPFPPPASLSNQQVKRASQSASTLFGNSGGRSSARTNASVSDGRSARTDDAKDDKGKQKGPETPTPALTQTLPWNTERRLPSLKRELRTHKSHSSPVDPQPSSNESPSAPAISSEAPTPSSHLVPKQPVCNTSSQDSNVDRAVSAGGFPSREVSLADRPTPPSQLLRATRQNSGAFNEYGDPEGLDGVERSALAPHDKTAIVSPPRDQGRKISPSRKESLRSATAPTSANVSSRAIPGEQETRISTSGLSSTPADRTNTRKSMVKSRPELGSSSKSKPARAYTSQTPDLDRAHNTQVYLQETFKNAEAAKNLHFTRKKASQANGNGASVDTVPTVETQPILLESSATPELDSGRQGEVVDKMLDAPSDTVRMNPVECKYSPPSHCCSRRSALSLQDSDASVPLIQKIDKRTLQIVTDRSGSFTFERPVVSPMHQSQSATSAETVVSPTTAPTPDISSPSSPKGLDSDLAVTESFAAPMLKRPKPAKKAPQLFLVRPKPVAYPNPRKAQSKRKVEVLDTEQSIELATEAESRATKKARTKSLTPPDIEPAPPVSIVASDGFAPDTRAPENWLDDTEANAKNAQTIDSAQIAAEQRQEVALPPLDIPVDDVLLSAEVSLSRPPITTIPPIWAEVRRSGCLDSASELTSFTDTTRALRVIRTLQ